MFDAHDSINKAIEEAETALSIIRRGKSKQLSSKEDGTYLQSFVYSWTQKHFKVVGALYPNTDLSNLNSVYSDLLSLSSKRALRKKYITILKSIKTMLVGLRSTLLVAAPFSPPSNSNQNPPSFASLAVDPQMQKILTRRWNECQCCIDAGAHLAATVMMGGLLEALFVAKANKMPDKSPLFKAATTPKDKQSKKAIPLTEWTLRPYLDVGHELGWIGKSGKDVATILRDYRNYIHPEKERSHSVELTEDDSKMFWAVTKELIQQLLK